MLLEGAGLFAPGVVDRPPAPRSCCLQIAGIRYRMRSEPDGPPLAVPPAAGPFLISDDGSPVDVEATCRLGNLAWPSPARLLFDSGGTWRLYQEADGSYLFRFHTPLRQPHPYKMARFREDFSRGEVWFHAPYFPEGQPIYPLEYPLDELVMVHLLAAGRGVELHACGLVDTDGRGLLFLGPSGAGKSTTARLWLREHGVRILSDDRIVLRRDGQGRFWMFGTPWHGDAELAAPATVPLSAVFLLRQAPRNRLTACAGGEQVARLAACAFTTFHSSAGLATTFRFLGDVAAAIPCYTLDFVPEPSVVALVRETGLPPGLG